MEFFNQASSILATLAPAAGIVNTGFAFQNYDAVWKAMDGDLGNYVRAQIEKSGIVSVSRAWDNGFRQISSSTRVVKKPEDLKGFKIRVPQAPMLDLALQGTRRRPRADQLQRALFGAADRRGGRPGESAADHRDGQAL